MKIIHFTRNRATLLATPSLRWLRQSAFVVLGLVIVTNLSGCQEAHHRKVPALPVEVASVTQGNLPITVDTLGQAVPIHSVTVTPQVSGTLQAVYVHSGQWVTRGQPLFLINPAMYSAEAAQDKGNLQGEMAQAHYDALQVQAYKPLIAKNYVTMQTYQEAVASAETANATVAADQAALQQAELNLSYTRINAPISGQVGLLTIKSGNLVAANSTTLTTINQTQPIKAQFSLPEKTLEICVMR
jgi:RND family efflux transporter, MFP subunit